MVQSFQIKSFNMLSNMAMASRSGLVPPRRSGCWPECQDWKCPHNSTLTGLRGYAAGVRHLHIELGADNHAMSKGGLVAAILRPPALSRMRLFSACSWAWASWTNRLAMCILDNWELWSLKSLHTNVWLWLASGMAMSMWQNEQVRLLIWTHWNLSRETSKASLLENYFVKPGVEEQ